MNKTEILDRDVLENIIDNIDINEIAHKAFDDVRYYSNYFTGSIVVNINAETGEVENCLHINNSIAVTDDIPRINLFNIPFNSNCSDEYFINDYKDIFVKDEHIAYYKELQETEDDIEDFEIKDMVIEKFNLNEYELEEEYYKKLDMLNFDSIYETNIYEQLEEIYDDIEN